MVPKSKAVASLLSMALVFLCESVCSEQVQSLVVCGHLVHDLQLVLCNLFRKLASE